MNQLQADRMMTWAHFIEKHVEPTELNMTEFVEESENNCATVACAVGWLPAIFSDWKWTQNENTPSLSVDSIIQPFTDVGNFFGLSGSQIDAITFSDRYEDDPTPKQVAERIRSVAEQYDWVPA